jgi:hypothetical protein
VLEKLWNNIEWEKRKVNGKKRVELKMEGASQNEWWDKVVLPSLPRLVRLDRGGAEDSR